MERRSTSAPTPPLMLLGALLLSLQAPAANAGQDSCGCPDGRTIHKGDWLRAVTDGPAISVDPERLWARHEGGGHFWRGRVGMASSLTSTSRGCGGSLDVMIYVKDGRKLLSVAESTPYSDLCELAIAVTDTPEAKPEAPPQGKEPRSLGALAEAGRLEEALAGKPLATPDGARAVSPVSPYPMAFGPFAPGDPVRAIRDTNGPEGSVKKGQYGIVLGTAKQAGLLRVGFYCKRLSAMNALGGLGVGAIFNDCTRTCAREVPFAILGFTVDPQPIRGAP
jgi:hypothetical protein